MNNYHKIIEKKIIFLRKILKINKRRVISNTTNFIKWLD